MYNNIEVIIIKLFINIGKSKIRPGAKTRKKMNNLLPGGLEKSILYPKEKRSAKIKVKRNPVTNTWLVKYWAKELFKIKAIYTVNTNRIDRIMIKVLFIVKTL